MGLAAEGIFARASTTAAGEKSPCEIRASACWEGGMLLRCGVDFSLEQSQRLVIVNASVAHSRRSCNVDDVPGVDSSCKFARNLQRRRCKFERPKTAKGKPAPSRATIAV